MDTAIIARSRTSTPQENLQLPLELLMTLMCKMLLSVDVCGCSNKTDVTSYSVRHPASWGRWKALNTVDRRLPALVLRAATERRATSALTPRRTSSRRTFRRHTACRSRPGLVRQRSASTLHHIRITTTPWPQPGPATIRTHGWLLQQVHTTPHRTTITPSHSSTSPIDINCLPE